MAPPVLVVDDEPGLRALLTRWLVAGEYAVLEASSAETAVDLLSRTPGIAVAIVDLQMPGQGGAWLVQQIRAYFPNTAVVLATGDPMVPGSVSLQPGVIGYCVKPLERRTVMTHVAEGVRWSAEQAAAAVRREATDPIEAFLDRKLNQGRDRADGD